MMYEQIDQKSARDWKTIGKSVLLVTLAVAAALAIVDVVTGHGSRAVGVENPLRTASRAWGGSGTVPAGGACEYHWVGSDCQNGLDCMVLSSGFCTKLGSLPEGEQCANTGNAYDTFCQSGMTCCSGKCVGLATCAAGKAGDVSTIVATGETIAKYAKEYGWIAEDAAELAA